jgi:hypothetical protein
MTHRRRSHRIVGVHCSDCLAEMPLSAIPWEALTAEWGRRMAARAVMPTGHKPEMDGPVKHVEGFFGCQCDQCKKFRADRRAEKEAALEQKLANGYRATGRGRPKLVAPKLPNGSDMTEDQHSRWRQWRYRKQKQGKARLEAAAGTEVNLGHVVGLPIGVEGCHCELCEEYQVDQARMLEEMQEQDEVYTRIQAQKNMSWEEMGFYK